MVSFADDVQPIFTQNCATAGCHTGANPPQGLNLSEGVAYGMIVDVPSNESPLDRIEPGSSADSYLVHKIDGTQASVGGSGVQMPFGQPQLSEMLRDIIRVWADEGALDN